MKKILIITVIVSVFTCACGPSAEELVPTYVAQTAQAEQNPQKSTQLIEQSVNETMSAIEAAFTLTPTITFTPSSSPTSTETLTPTPAPMAEVIVDKTYIRGGPGSAYKIMGEAVMGDTFDAIGVSLDGKWVVVDLGQFEKGWILITDVSVTVELETLAQLEDPPTPVPDYIIITIVNHRSTKSGLWIKIPGGDYIKRVSVDPNKETSFKFDRGTYEILYSYGGAGLGLCIHGLYTFTHDILWIPTDNSVCGVFP